MAPTALFLLLVLAVLAAPAQAQGTWSGNGTYTMTSTPSSPPCSAQGTTHISLEENSGSLTGTLTFTETSETSGCNGRLNGGGTAHLTGTISGGSVRATDEYGDTWTGTLSGGSLHLSLTSPPGPSNCVQYCRQNGQFSYTGSGTIGGGAGVVGTTAAVMAGALGIGAAGAAAASLRAPRIARSHEGFTYKFDNGVWTRLDGPAPWGYSAPSPPPLYGAAAPPAPPPAAELPAPPPILAPGVVAGPTINEGPTGGVFEGTPDKLPPPNPPTALDQTQGGPSCPAHQGHCIPALENLPAGPSLRWFCPLGGHYPWG